MKIEWTADDIKAGRTVGKPDRTERWMIGYFAARTGFDRWTLVSLSDGMVTEPVTKEQMADRLNASSELPCEIFAPTKFSQVAIR